MSVPTGPGLAVERTALAWRRTALSVAVGSLLCLRLLPPQLGPVGWVLSVLGLCWSADLAWIGWRRYHAAQSSLRPEPAAPPGGGGFIVRTVAITLAVGVVALVAAVIIASDQLSG